MKILHILYMSLPDFSGSSIRSRSIIISQKKIGIEPIVLTSPFQKPMNLGCKNEYIDGIKYIRTYNGNSYQEVNDNKSSLRKQFLKIYQIFSFRKRVYDEAKINKINLIHAHSTFFCGLAAMYAARKLSLPFVYEVRSLWELRIADRDNNISSWISSRLIKILETYVMKRADHVVVISKALKNEILDRGIPGNKISLISNAVVSEILDKGSVANWPVNRQCEFVFAYIGSITNIEGLELLLNAWKKFYKSNMLCKFKFYGDGVIKDKLVSKVKKENISNVEFCGVFFPNDIEKIYSKIDVIVNPRYKSKLSDTVTPLKPLEAMAFKKLMLASDVGGMKELISHNQTGYLFKSNDADSLTDLFNYVLYNDIKLLANVVMKGYDFVYSNCNWNINAVIYKKKIYAELLKKGVQRNKQINTVS